ARLSARLSTPSLCAAEFCLSRCAGNPGPAICATAARVGTPPIACLPQLPPSARHLSNHETAEQPPAPFRRPSAAEPPPKPPRRPAHPAPPPRLPDAHSVPPA